MSSWPSKLNKKLYRLSWFSSHALMQQSSVFLFARCFGVPSEGSLWVWMLGPGVTRHFVQTTFGRSSRPAWSRQGVRRKSARLSQMLPVVLPAVGHSGSTCWWNLRSYHGWGGARAAAAECHGYTPQHATATYWPTDSYCIYTNLPWYLQYLLCTRADNGN